MERIKQVSAHLSGSKRNGLATLEQKHPDDVVITMAIRSPLCKYKKGGFKDARTDELLLEMFKAAIAHSHIDPALVEDITVGTVLTPTAMYPARTAAMAAGFPETVPVQTVNRFCSSGLMAVADIANKVRSGQIEIGLAVGAESMSENPDDGGPAQSALVSCHGPSRDCNEKMGWTSENVAEEFNVTREEQDEFAAISFQNAERAQALGYFKNEIVPFTVFQKDPKTGEKKLVTITEDDGIRKGTTKETLLKIRSAFPQWGKGTTTGGNASQITDGAAAVLITNRRKAEELGLKILAKYINTSVVGVAPRIMGVGPVPAIRKLMNVTGLSIGDVDLWEINEAFASQSVYVLKELGLDRGKINVNGGAIALGHPLGCTGARQIATGLNELHRRKGKVLVTSMCIGTGMGAAAAFVREA